MLRRGGLVAVLILVAAGAPASAQVELAWKWKEGDKFYLESVSRFKQSLTLKDINREVKQEVEYATVLGFEVKTTGAEKNIVLEQRIESLKVSNAQGVAFRDDKLKGVVLRLTLNAKGDVTKVEGYAELIKKLTEDADGELADTIKATVTEDSLKRSAQLALGFLPDRPVKRGDTWERKARTSLGPLGSMEVTNRYVSEGPENVEGKSAEKIVFTTEATYEAPKPSDKPALYQVLKGELKSEGGKGAAYFDAAAGRLVKFENTIRLRGALTLATSGGGTVNTEVQQEETTTIRVTDQKPAEK